jgi:stage II sporulation protein D
MVPRAGEALPGFALHGAGWGHGVGLCQIGAAIMASKGMTAETIVKHYFRTAELQKLY